MESSHVKLEQQEGMWQWRVEWYAHGTARNANPVNERAARRHYDALLDLPESEGVNGVVLLKRYVSEWEPTV